MLGYVSTFLSFCAAKKVIFELKIELALIYVSYSTVRLVACQEQAQWPHDFINVVYGGSNRGFFVFCPADGRNAWFYLSA